MHSLSSLFTIIIVHCSLVCFPETLVYCQHDQIPSDDNVQDIQSPEPVLMCLKVQISMEGGLKVCVALVVMMTQGFIKVIISSYQGTEV